MAIPNHGGITQPIRGYRQLTPNEVALINDIKQFASKVGAALDDIESAESIALGIDADKRWLAIGRTQLQQGFMAVIRAIAKPEGF